MTPQELEEISFRNLVLWHRQDLIRIINGAFATNVFTDYSHRYLKKHGVLQLAPNTKYTKPTPRAMEILGKKE